MSSPLELSTSSFSPLIDETATGTSLASSARRVAVTMISPEAASIGASAAWATLASEEARARAETPVRTPENTVRRL